MAKKASSGHPNLVAFGKRLRAWRKAKNFSQEKLALEAGLDYSYVNEIENGKINPGLITIMALAEALKVTPAVFLVSAKLAKQLEASAVRLEEQEEAQLRACLQQPEWLPNYGKLIEDFLRHGQTETAQIWLKTLAQYHRENWRLDYILARYHVLRAFPKRSGVQKLAVAEPISTYKEDPASDIAAAWEALERALSNNAPDNQSRSRALKDKELQQLQQSDPNRWSTLLQDF
jgi:transcriptional regulator with XRE-family HTH domain